MKSGEIRNSFLDFFRSKGHETVRSSSLIPTNDPTLLFTNAGMVQFKSVFQGSEKRPYTKATTCQKCMRAGGKHSDIENVGHTARHHTFFEMLGNFSFGDYFKREAILFAWELLVDWYKLPKEQLWVSVYEEDDEAAGLWNELTGMPYERIVKLGPKDNFWQMGDTGPCGPCSEIILDQGEAFSCGREDCRVGCDCDRYLELWNLVFMQFDRDESGTLHPLPKPSIDTGMGLERLCAVLQGRKTNFDTDVFAPIIGGVESLSGVRYGRGTDSDVSMKVIADHIRAAAFLLSEGLMPSNEGRGYVLRRIIRRAARHAKLLGLEGAVLYRLIDAVAVAMGDTYPELRKEQERAAKVLRFEEERFARTLDQGMGILDTVIGSLKRTGEKTIPGDELFRLYDTFGFPLDLARDIAVDHHLSLDETGFHREMEAQRERARAAWVGEDEEVASIYRELSAEIGETTFLGYETLEADSVIKAILKEGKVVKEASEGEEVEIFLDKTPFYGESGGQVGDEGVLISDGAEAVVVDTKKGGELHSHVAKVIRGRFQVWQKALARVDGERRAATARNHTATHLLHAALRVVLGEQVKQAGSYVDPERLRFDFSHFHALDAAEIAMIEERVNRKVLDNVRVETEVSDIQEALRSGVVALFGEKYGEMVRIVRVPGFSAELCGGTHCRATGDIGLFVVASEGSVASGIRRIEAFSGTRAFEYLRGKSDELQRIAEMLKSDRPVERVEKLLADLKEADKECDSLKAKLAAQSSTALLEAAREVKGMKVLSCRVDNLEQKDLRVLADNLRDRLGSGVVVVASVKDGQASMVAMVTKDLTKRVSAGTLLKKTAELAGGRGGGKAEMAQGGVSPVTDPAALDKALEAVYEIVEKE